MSATPVIPDNVVAYYARGSMPRGVRNNNPGNVRLGDAWQGMCDVQTDKSFCQFTDIKFGMRVLGYLMRMSYYQRLHLDTVTKLITRWAPSTENDTPAYIAAVSTNLRVGPQDIIDLRNDAVLGDLIACIIKHECGAQPYTGLQIMSGIRLL